MLEFIPSGESEFFAYDQTSLIQVLFLFLLLNTFR